MATLNIKNLDDGLYQRLKERAASQHRSVSQEVTHILSETLSDARPLSVLELEGLGRHLWKGVNAAEHVATERDSWD
jgi:plasmid stability protein